MTMSGGRIRDHIDHIFSRKLLGSVFVGSSAMKIVEKIIALSTTSTEAMLVGWGIAFVAAVVLFVYWNRIESETDELLG